MSTEASFITRVAAAVLVMAATVPSTGHSQSLFERNRGPSVSGKADAPIDLTGTWVSIINEDWRWRMITPARGDFQSIPLNAAGKAAGMQWNPDSMSEADQCKPYGVGGLMRVPMRMKISWQDDNTLKVEADAGTQTRLLRFRAQFDPAAAGTLQGQSLASWTFPTGPGRPAPDGKHGSLKVITKGMLPGYLRSNGVPYSDEATLTEHWELQAGPDGKPWIVITSIMDDPAYLAVPYVTSPNFRKELSSAGWNPRPCTATW